MKTLFLLNMSYKEDWDSGIVNRNFHIAEQIKNSGDYDQLFLVDFVPFSFRKKVKLFLKRRTFRSNGEVVYRSKEVIVVRDKNNKQQFYVQSFSNNGIEEVIRQWKLRDEDLTFWSYSPFASSIFEAHQEAFCIFDAVDDWSKHPAYSERVEELEGHYKTIEAHADLIFTVSEALVDLFHKKENVIFVPNAVEVDHFTGMTCDPNILPTQKHPIIGYHGIIQDRLNFNIIEYLATKHVDYQFVLIGPIWKSVKKKIDALRRLPNVHVIGPVPYQSLPAAIACFDVAMIPHSVDAFTQTMNPLKLYEYLATGKPIVTSAVAGANQFPDVVTVAVSPEDFSTAIEELLESDSPELMERRLALVQQHDWHARFKTMQERIQQAPNHQ